MPIIKNEVAFITGGASGVGRAIAESITSQGGRVIIADINQDAGSKFVEELNTKYTAKVAIAVKVDTTNWDDQVAALEVAKETFGRIDYVFANAGIAELPWIPGFDPSTAASRPITKPNLATLNIDLVGQINTAALALQHFERQEKGANGFRGKLIMTASVFGYYPCANMPMYAAAKAGVVNFMRSTAEFYQDKDITVNAVAPNLIDTNIAPDVLFVPFRERKLLTPIELVIKQVDSLLGESALNGQAISINGEDVWTHPRDPHKYEENAPALDLISSEIGKLFGYTK